MKTDIEQLKELVDFEHELLGHSEEVNLSHLGGKFIDTRPALESVIKRYEEMEKALHIIATDFIHGEENRGISAKGIYELATQALEQSDEERGKSDEQRKDTGTD
jgi:pyruvate carboxylase